MAKHVNELKHSFGFLIHDIARLMNRYYDRRMRVYGITRTQWTILSYLARCEGVSQTKLADYMNLAPMTLTRQIDKLQADGLIDRKQDPQDRRINLIYLTKKSQPLMQHMHEIAVEAKEAALKGFSEEEREVLRKFLIQTRSNIESA